MKIKRAEKPVLAITAVLIALILVGEIYVYTVNPDDMYGSSCTFENSEIKYSVSSNSSNQYSVVVTDNGDESAPEDVYIYYDSEYESTAVSEKQPIGSKPLTEKYYLDQLEKQLANRGVKIKGWLNADGLRDFMMSGHSTDGLIMASGSIPETVYNGEEGSLFENWIKDGGSLYWVGGMMGKTVSQKGSTYPANTDYQAFFFDGDCLNGTDSNVATEDYLAENDYRHSLSIMNNRVKYGFRIGTGLGLGYSESGYVSAGLVECGEGMICIVGGDYSNNQRADLAQIISAGLMPVSEEVHVDVGTVTRGTVNGTITNEYDGDELSVYIYLGGYYVVYGKCYKN